MLQLLQRRYLSLKELRKLQLKMVLILKFWKRIRLLNLEPNIFALKALFSPTTGIVDTHSLMKQFETNILNNGGQIVYGSEVTGIRKIEEGYEITLLDSDKKNFSFTTGIIDQFSRTDFR